VQTLTAQQLRAVILDPAGDIVPVVGCPDERVREGRRPSRRRSYFLAGGGGRRTILLGTFAGCTV